MLRAEPANRSPDEDSIDASKYRQRRCQLGIGAACREFTQDEIADVNEPQYQRRGQARVPRPPDSPSGPTPDRPREQNDGAEDDSDFGGRDGESIKRGMALYQVRHGREKIGREAQ